MQNKKIAITTIAILVFSTFILMPVKAIPSLSLPTDPVTLVIARGTPQWPGIVTLSDVPSGDYDVTNSPPTYNAFCSQFNNWASYGTSYSATLVSSLSLSAPWNQINYLLNNQGGDGTMDVQFAAWLILGFTEAEINTRFTVTTEALSMASEANTLGSTFIPTVGQLVAVICETEGEAQDLFIVLEIPEDDDYEGLTPGFWKNCKFDWPEDYDKEDLFNTIFDTNTYGYDIEITINSGKKSEEDNPTLMEALKAKGGLNEEKDVYDALARHAVAALLNAAHPDVNYPMSEQEIIDAVAEAINNEDAGSLKDMLESYNQLGGGLNAHGDPI